MDTKFTPRILIVEDDDGTVETLKAKLKRKIQNVDVVTASNIRDGQNAIESAYNEGRIFNVALLDFKLPKDNASGNEDESVSLSYQSDLLPHALLIHMTAWPKDPIFLKSRPEEGTPGSVNRMYVGKITGTGWMRTVVEACRKHIASAEQQFHTKRIKDRWLNLQQSSGDSGEGHGHWRRRTSGQGDRLRSLETAAFCSDAGVHWEFLDKALQDQLASAFGHAEDARGNHYVGVIVQDTEGGDAQTEECP